MDIGKDRTDLFSIGLDTCCPPFEGLRERLSGYRAEIRNRIGGMGL